ncbi:hypothetical protein HK100_010491, partial [Physocladia obscura]
TWFQLAATGVTATYCPSSSSSIAVTAAAAVAASSSSFYSSQAVTATADSSSSLSTAAVTAANAVGGNVKSDGGVSLIGFYGSWMGVTVGNAFLSLMN